MTEMTADEIDGLLAGARIGRLCMADPEGRPYAIPLPFCWTDRAIYLRLPLSGRKGEILADNDQVCFEIDTFTDTFDEYASVLIQGRLVPVLGLEEKSHVKQINDEKYNRLRRGYRPGHGRAAALEQLPLRKIVNARITGRKKSADQERAVSASA